MNIAKIKVTDDISEEKDKLHNNEIEIGNDKTILMSNYFSAINNYLVLSIAF